MPSMSDEQLAATLSQANAGDVPSGVAVINDPTRIKIFDIHLEKIGPTRLKITMISDVLEPFMLKQATPEGETEPDLCPDLAPPNSALRAYRGKLPTTLQQVTSYGHGWGAFVLYPIDYAAELIKTVGINSQGVTIEVEYARAVTKATMRSIASTLRDTASTIYREFIMPQTVSARLTAVTSESANY